MTKGGPAGTGRGSHTSPSQQSAPTSVALHLQIPPTEGPKDLEKRVGCSWGGTGSHAKVLGPAQLCR